MFLLLTLNKLQLSLCYLILPFYFSMLYYLYIIFTYLIILSRAYIISFAAAVTNISTSPMIIPLHKRVARLSLRFAWHWPYEHISHSSIQYLVKHLWWSVLRNAKGSILGVWHGSNTSLFMITFTELTRSACWDHTEKTCNFWIYGDFFGFESWIVDLFLYFGKMSCKQNLKV